MTVWCLFEDCSDWEWEAQDLLGIYTTEEGAITARNATKPGHCHIEFRIKPMEVQA